MELALTKKEYLEMLETKQLRLYFEIENADGSTTVNPIPSKMALVYGISCKPGRYMGPNRRIFGVNGGEQRIDMIRIVEEESEETYTRRYDTTYY